MSILTRVEQRSFSGRIFIAAVTAVLRLGGITMVYPFVLMLSGSLRSDMDSSRMDLVPDFLTDVDELVRKFLETKYNNNPSLMNRYRQTGEYDFASAAVPDDISSRYIREFRLFLSETSFPGPWQALGGTRSRRGIASDMLYKFRKRVRDACNGDLSRAGRITGVPLSSWSRFDLIMPRWEKARFSFTSSLIYKEYFKLARERPPAEKVYVNLSGAFLQDVIYPEYGMAGPGEYNARHARKISAYSRFSLPCRVPPLSEPVLRKEWLSFVRDYCNVSFIRADVGEDRYRSYLQERFGNIESLRKRWADAPDSFAGIMMPGDKEWVRSSQSAVYGDFLASLQPETLRLVGPEFAWQEWLCRRYSSLESLNSARLRRSHALMNYRTVLEEVFVRGRPFLNTVIYVCLALVFALTVQPLAAYALSRFNPPGTWKFIFVFMATMAFPPMVSTLPMFLMIKKLHLLNTFAALVLPLAVNGYLVFLLKGFFDSIPKHLYEAAAIEGASELCIFRNVAMALSKPILAVVALNAFHAAWMSFMYPLIVCPDENMHVLAVWLHRFQRGAPGPAVFASILVASIPSLLVFLAAQNTIMKGIAVPAEK